MIINPLLTCKHCGHGYNRRIVNENGCCVDCHWRYCRVCQNILSEQELKYHDTNLDTQSYGSCFSCLKMQGQQASDS